MPEFRYDTTNNWYKGNTHVHSTASDGGKTFPELAEMYAGADFDFLFRTDHRICSTVSADAEEAPLLWLDGIEMDGNDETGGYFHAVGLGTMDPIDHTKGFAHVMESAREQGAFVILAHPLWSGNSMEDALRWKFDGVEIYNHVCHWLNGKSGGLTHWDAMLHANVNTLAFASDDAHVRAEHPGWNGGWIVVNAPECTTGAVMAAIRRGNFYSSVGPEFRNLTFDGENVHFETSPIQFARVVGQGGWGNRLGSFDDDALFTEGSILVPDSLEYAYLEIEDDRGRRAWTNHLFVESE